MMKRLTRRNYSYYALIVLFTLNACYFQETRGSIVVKENQFKIDPSTILEGALQGEENIFIPADTEEEPEIYQPFLSNWKQSDYLIIADALHKFVWKESLIDWKLNSVIFSVDCDDLPYGFQYARFVYFKVIDDDKGRYRVVHTIFVDLYSKTANVSADKYSPLVMDWKELDLIKMNITSQEALKIIENDKGSELRKSINNDCTVSTSFYTTLPQKNKWVITYYTGNENVDFEVDPDTGEYK